MFGTTFPIERTSGEYGGRRETGTTPVEVSRSHPCSCSHFHFSSCRVSKDAPLTNSPMAVFQRWQSALAITTKLSYRPTLTSRSIAFYSIFATPDKTTDTSTMSSPKAANPAAKAAKRPAEANDPSISPPPIKRGKAKVSTNVTRMAPSVHSPKSIGLRSGLANWI